MKKNAALFLFLLFIYTFNSCKKEELPPTNDTPDDTPNVIIDSITPVSGTIILPNNYPGTTNGWLVHSGFNTSIVSADSFSINEAYNQFGLLAATNSSNELQLVGLVYPGQTDYSISAASTVRAILMSVPAAAYLSSAGKIALLNQINASPLFNDAVADIENALLMQQPIFDTNNVGFKDRLAAIFEDAAMRIGQIQSNPIVDLQRAGRIINIQNPGNSFAVSVQVYKNDSLQTSFILDPYKRFPGSVGEIIGGLFNPGNVIERSVTLSGDGTFEIKVRSGRPFSGIVDEGSILAFKENMTNMAFDNAGAFLPMFIGNQNCRTSIKSLAYSISSTYTSVLALNNGSFQSFVSIAYQIAESTMALIESANACFPSNASLDFLTSIKTFTKFVDNVSKIGQVMNNSAFLYDYYSSPASFDTCFVANGNSVTPCTTATGPCGGLTYINDGDGNDYNLVEIGDRCWFKENLRTTTFSSGSAFLIPEIQDSLLWENTTQPAWCNFGNNSDNDTIYGKIYNYYAISDSRNVCPTGFHVATYDDFASFIVVCGPPFNTLGGKLKSIDYWNAPNTGATDELGLSIRGAGYRDGNFGFGCGYKNLNENTRMWFLVPSTNTAVHQEFSYDDAAFLPHNHGAGIVSTNAGSYVRCVKD
jgi:uncharacterized protein (TIGR02145 family)